MKLRKRNRMKYITGGFERDPDSDMKSAYASNSDSFPFDIREIQNIFANVPGHNDEDHWYWIVEVKKQFYLIEAWCDYTGWDCQSGATVTLGRNPHDCCLKVKEEDKRQNLINQLVGTQPYGTEIKGE